MKKFSILLILIIQGPLYSQGPLALEDDPCGYDPEFSAATLKLFGTGWGYTYDSLLADLSLWKNSPFVTIDSAGASVQNRGIWLVTIKDTIPPTSSPLRITIHSRTHPNEVQATWVTNEIIDALIGNSQLAKNLRTYCEFNIIPMYNPDGVELELGRQNANGVDLERDWIETSQPETATLRGLFESYMAGDAPVRIALNMHSALACKRYFVYHHENGTSEAYAIAERFFISSIREIWPKGIEPWNYYISWTSGTPPYYPESWFWLNHQEAVMALTYEDMNCPEAGDYDLTANALLEGITDFLGIRETGIQDRFASSVPPQVISDIMTYPNPAASGLTTHIQFSLRKSTSLKITLYDLLGRKVTDLIQANRSAGLQEFTLSLPKLTQGFYILQISGPQIRRSVPLMILN